MTEAIVTLERVVKTSFPGGETRPARPAARGSAAKTGHEGAPDETDAHSAISGERALWRAVIVQALMDASCGSAKQEAIQWKQEALIWLRGNSKDFSTVAHHAGFEPEYLRAMIARALAGNCVWRALPGEGSRIRRTRPKSERRAGQRR